MARWTQLFNRWNRHLPRRLESAPAGRKVMDDAVLEAAAFKAAAGRAIERGDSRGIVIATIGVDQLDGGGEALMVAAESRVARAVRPRDVIGRLGAGRLAVLAGPDEGRDGAARIAERVADRLAEPFHIGGREVEPGLRIGTANAGGDDADGLIRRAEESLATLREDRA